MTAFSKSSEAFSSEQPDVDRRMRLLVPSVEHRLVVSVQKPAGKVTADTAKLDRRREFELGRKCAKEMLGKFGAAGPVGVNPDRSPEWPNGFVGSISHSNHWTWAAVADKSNVRSLGVDTEPIVSSKTRSNVESNIATNEELETVAGTGLNPEQAISVVFSAKEAFYKCWYPVRQEFFGFEQAVVELATNEYLKIRCLKGNPNFGHEPTSLNVFYFVSANDVFTFTWMEQN